MLLINICHHIKSNLINCYVCFLSFSYILYNPLILFCQAWSLRLAAWSLRPEATSEIEAQRQLFTGIPGLISLSTAHWSQVHHASNVRFALAMDQGSVRLSGISTPSHWSQVHWIEAQRQLFTGAPGLNRNNPANRPGISEAVRN